MIEYILFRRDEHSPFLKAMQTRFFPEALYFQHREIGHHKRKDELFAYSNTKKR
jgi:hypothetical protein